MALRPYAPPGPAISLRSIRRAHILHNTHKIRAKLKDFIDTYPIKSAYYPTAIAGEHAVAARLESAAERKVRAPRGGMIVNGDQGKPSGKCHRKQTASGKAHKAAWGKGETAS